MTPPAGPTTLLCQTRSTPLALAPHRQVIVEFRAPWCGPCRGIDSFIGQLSAKYSDVLFVTVDVEDVEALQREYDIQATPTFVALQGTTEKERTFGAVRPKIEAMAKRYSKY